MLHEYKDEMDIKKAPFGAFCADLLIRVVLDEFNGVANRLNFFSGVVWDFNAEFLFKLHNQFDGV